MRAGLKWFGQNRVVYHGLLNFATVRGGGELLYFIVTDAQTNNNGLRDWKDRMKTVVCPNLRKFHEVAHVE